MLVINEQPNHWTVWEDADGDGFIYRAHIGAVLREADGYQPYRATDSGHGRFLLERQGEALATLSEAVAVLSG